jgi:hypothetical protein
MLLNHQNLISYYFFLTKNLKWKKAPHRKTIAKPMFIIVSDKDAFLNSNRFIRLPQQTKQRPALIPYLSIKGSSFILLFSLPKTKIINTATLKNMTRFANTLK